jgi:hypothetical protein
VFWSAGDPATVEALALICALRFFSEFVKFAAFPFSPKTESRIVDPFFCAAGVFVAVDDGCFSVLAVLRLVKDETL